MIGLFGAELQFLKCKFGNLIMRGQPLLADGCALSQLSAFKDHSTTEKKRHICSFAGAALNTQEPYYLVTKDYCCTAAGQAAVVET